MPVNSIYSDRCYGCFSLSYIKELTLMIKGMEKEYITGQMEQNMKDIFTMT